MKVVVGLGNPGQQYQNTRHNVGFEVLGELARRFDGFGPQIKFEAEVVEIQITLPAKTDGRDPSDKESRVAGTTEKVLLVAPQTYMNESGRSVRKVVDFYNLDVDNLLIVCDDLDLSSGKLRLRGSGSAGGQKGLQNIIQHLKTDAFARLKLGIGRPPGQMNASRYVLGKISGNERETLDEAVFRATGGVETWCKEGLTTAMNSVNAPKE